MTDILIHIVLAVTPLVYHSNTSNSICNSAYIINIMNLLVWNDAMVTHLECHSGDSDNIRSPMVGGIGFHRHFVLASCLWNSSLWFWNVVPFIVYILIIIPEVFRFIVQLICYINYFRLMVLMIVLMLAYSAITLVIVLHKHTFLLLLFEWKLYYLRN